MRAEKELHFIGRFMESESKKNCFFLDPMSNTG